MDDGTTCTAQSACNTFEDLCRIVPQIKIDSPAPFTTMNDVMSGQDCCAQCRALGSSCVAYTWTTLKNQCLLYTAIISIIPSFDSTSGVVAQSCANLDPSSPRDCATIKTNVPSSTSGVYTIKPYTDCSARFPKSCCVDVYCDMQTTGGGWTVFQKRYDGSQTFQLPWTDYKNGFGQTDAEYWLGLEHIRELTTVSSSIMILLGEVENPSCSMYAEYSDFKIENDGAEFSYHSGYAFSTYDKDQDTHVGNCAAVYKGGWWYGDCHYVNFNGLYYPGCLNSSVIHTEYMVTSTSRGRGYSYEKSAMMIRPASFFGDSNLNNFCGDDRNISVCPDDCMWSNWGSWSDCTSLCGNGTQQRSRSHLRERTSTAYLDCFGSFLDERNCSIDCDTICMEGWAYLEASDSCYYVLTSYATYSEGQQSCNSMGGCAAMIKSQDEQDFVASLLTGIMTPTSNTAYIGATDEAMESIFQWVDGSLLTATYMSFDGSEPTGNFAAVEEDCVAIYAPYSMKWIDLPCNSDASFVCQRHGIRGTTPGPHGPCSFASTEQSCANLDPSNPRNCAAIKTNAPSSTSGVYTIKPYADCSARFPKNCCVDVYCDMHTTGGGWTVFQRRFNGSQTFVRPWTDYTNGFGQPDAEYWLGLEHVAELTNESSSIMILLGEVENPSCSVYAEYSEFKIKMDDTYAMTFGSFINGNLDSGDFGYHNGYAFTTYDNDQDTNPVNCAAALKGGWWHGSCHMMNLNGLYFPGCVDPPENTQYMVTLSSRGREYSYERTAMMIRPVSFVGDPELNNFCGDDRNISVCPDDCMWAEWGSWSDCTSPCGNGTQQRSRSHLRERSSHDYMDCIGAYLDERNCSVDCDTTTSQLCVEGWSYLEASDSCYYILPDASTYSAGQLSCNSMGGSAAMIKSQDEQNFVASLLTAIMNATHDFAFIGATDEAMESIFLWIDCSLLTETYMSFDASEPTANFVNDPVLEEDCVAMHSPYSMNWADLPCHRDAFFVCQKQGIRGTTPGPHSPCSPASSTVLTTTPRCCTEFCSLIPGSVWSPSTCSCINVGGFFSQLSWSQSYDSCKSSAPPGAEVKGRLAFANNQAAVDILKEKASSSLMTKIWIGLKSLVKPHAVPINQSEWFWHDGDLPVAPLTFVSGDSTGHENQMCMMIKQNGKLENGGCSIGHHYGCEYLSTACDNSMSSTSLLTTDADDTTLMPTSAFISTTNPLTSGQSIYQTTTINDTTIDSSTNIIGATTNTADNLSTAKLSISTMITADIVVTTQTTAKILTTPISSSTSSNTASVRHSSESVVVTAEATSSEETDVSTTLTFSKPTTEHFFTSKTTNGNNPTTFQSDPNLLTTAISSLQTTNVETTTETYLKPSSEQFLASTTTYRSEPITVQTTPKMLTTPTSTVQLQHQRSTKAETTTDKLTSEAITTSEKVSSTISTTSSTGQLSTLSNEATTSATIAKTKTVSISSTKEITTPTSFKPSSEQISKSVTMMESYPSTRQTTPKLLSTATSTTTSTGADTTTAKDSEVTTITPELITSEQTVTTIMSTKLSTDHVSTSLTTRANPVASSSAILPETTVVSKSSVKESTTVMSSETLTQQSSILTTMVTNDTTNYQTTPKLSITETSTDETTNAKTTTMKVTSETIATLHGKTSADDMLTSISTKLLTDVLSSAVEGATTFATVRETTTASKSSVKESTTLISLKPLTEDSTTRTSTMIKNYSTKRQSTPKLSTPVTSTTVQSTNVETTTVILTSETIPTTPEIKTYGKIMTSTISANGLSTDQFSTSSAVRTHSATASTTITAETTLVSTSSAKDTSAYTSFKLSTEQYSKSTTMIADVPTTYQTTSDLLTTVTSTVSSTNPKTARAKLTSDTIAITTSKRKSTANIEMSAGSTKLLADQHSTANDTIMKMASKTRKHETLSTLEANVTSAAIYNRSASYAPLSIGANNSAAFSSRQQYKSTAYPSQGQNGFSNYSKSYTETVMTKLTNHSTHAKSQPVLLSKSVWPRPGKTTKSKETKPRNGSWLNYKSSSMKLSSKVSTGKSAPNSNLMLFTPRMDWYNITTHKKYNHYSGTTGEKRHSIAPAGMSTLQHQEGMTTKFPLEHPNDLLACWAAWSWSPCDVTCGKGYRKARRLMYPERICGGPETKKEVCDMNISCAKDCEWAAWGQWGPCNATCGQGTSIRLRGISKEAEKHGKPCSGTNMKHKNCQGNCTETPLDPSMEELLFLSGIEPPFLDNKAAVTAAIQDSTAFLAAELPMDQRMKLGHNFSESVPLSFYDQKPTDEIDDWQTIYNPTLGNCFTFNHKFPAKYDSYQAGTDHGLTMLLQSSQQEYTCASPSAGFRIYIHNSTEYPFPDSGGTNIAPGSVTGISISRVRIERLPKPYGDCIHEPATPYYFSGSYSLEGCFRSCFQDSLIGNCSCGDPRLPVPPGRKHCTLKKKECLDHYRNCEADITSQCHCKQPCKQSIFKQTLTVSEMKINDKLRHACRRKHARNETGYSACIGTFRKNFALVRVYYEALNSRHYLETASFEIAQLISDLGGVISILLGVSAISFVEFIFALVALLAYVTFGNRLQLF